ncbi:HMP/thiamine import ATP-binding protein [Corynebacterium pseudotuberculosis]|uniref:ABC transporter ATP-binding protein n=1 Tax=Corynebacterium pseudotuberculosis TaxID=1719 RepID=UPI00065E6109|nr:ABC transporter ATP-binding protein [Corynebacterium pseudotuberculosis]AKP08416.1 HMP/thiamine import ATP-binding protein [Corynebacterium pseudotuberculosis]
MAPQIYARDFGYRHSSRLKHALQGLNFEVERGERILLLGASGAGKSTLLSALAGVLGADEGEGEGTLKVHATPGMVLQDPDSQVISSRVGDDVAFGCENLRLPKDEIWRRVPIALDHVGLRLPLDHPTALLSGGQKQRLALAGVLAMGADLLLLDEPTANLDPQGVRDVVAAVETAADATNATVIIIEHRVDTWLEFVDRIIVLGDEGSIIADAPADTVISQYGEELARGGVWVPGHDPLLPLAQPVSSSAENALTTHSLATGWDSPVQSSLDLALPRGFSTVLTGVNGAGKTTTLLTLAGLLPPLGGEVRVNREIAGKLGPHPYKWSSTSLAARMGYVFQDPEHQFVAKTVREELLVGAGSGQTPKPEAHRRADALLAKLRLDHLAEANPFTLSGGQKRRLSVATILVNTPSVVFLDEPTFGQDRRTFTELVLLLRQLTDAGSTVVSITHDPLYRAALGDKEIQL